MSLTPDEVRHVADLARLRLSDEEVQMFARQMSDILNYFKDLDDIDTTDVKVTSQVTGLKNVFREDEVIHCDDQIKQKIFQEAPHFKDGYFVVPNSISNNK